jgi:hypothetical protein
MRGGQSLILSGLILRRIFDRNQQEFTSADPKTIPTIAVVEEAQSVLNDNATASEPYVSWVKEGRKNDLGALLITQQPGSIPVEILSQGDNWFIFHLLSAADLASLKRANAHFSDDLLSSLLNEPIPGQGVFWSSVAGKTYPISLRVDSFEEQFSVRDRDYRAPAGNTFASILRADFSSPAFDLTSPTSDAQPQARGPDAKDTIENQAIAALRADKTLLNKLRSKDGMPWYGFQLELKNVLPAHLDDRDQFAYNLVPRALSDILGGTQDSAWEGYTNAATGKRWVRGKT